MSLLDSVSSITNNADTFASFAGKAIVKVSNSPSIAAFLFDGIDLEQIILKSEVTDHWTEDNTAIHDHIANSPLEFTLNGYIGELVKKENSEIPLSKIPYLKNLGSMGAINGKLQLLSAYLPKYTNQIQQAFNQINQTYETAKKYKELGTDIWNKYKKKPTEPKQNFQTKAFYFFKNLRDNRQFLDVDTFVGTFSNMVIIDLTIEQKDSIYISSFSITLKQMQFAISPNINKDDKFTQQKSDTRNIGNVKGKGLKDNESALHKMGVSKVLKNITGALGF